jgi:hypothetical protein
MEYSEYESPTGSKSIVRTDEDGTVWYIPLDESNSDYQAYLAYLAEQETA